MNKRLIPSLILMAGAAAVPFAASILADESHGGWRTARVGFDYSFPRDHFAHREYRTEWWYFTGHLEDENGREFGFQVTFFRHGTRPPDSHPPASSEFVVDAIHFAHFAVSDLQGDDFRFAQRTARGAFGEAGNGTQHENRIAWIDDWSLDLIQSEPSVFRIRAAMGEGGPAIALNVAAEREPVVHGERGISQKAAGEGNASCYYSIPILRASGTLTLDGTARRVTGAAWLDREWGTSQLGDDQVGWDWFSLQFDDGSQLMVYQLRRRDGSMDPHSAGTFVAPDGSITRLGAADIEAIPTRTWKSRETQARYPVDWKLQIPRIGIVVDVESALDDQELDRPPVIYWEGAVRAKGARNGRRIAGRGYLELTGYAEALSF